MGVCSSLLLAESVQYTGGRGGVGGGGQGGRESAVGAASKAKADRNNDLMKAISTKTQLKNGVTLKNSVPLLAATDATSSNGSTPETRFTLVNDLKGQSTAAVSSTCPSSPHTSF